MDNKSIDGFSRQVTRGRNKLNLGEKVKLVNF